MIWQPVSSNFPCSPLLSGLGELQACSFHAVVFPPFPLSALSSSPFHCASQDGFGKTWWTGDMSIPLQFRRLSQPQTRLGDLVLRISALPAHTIGKVFDQRSPAKLFTYWGTVWEMKLCILGLKKVEISRGRGLNYSICKLVKNIWSYTLPVWSTRALPLYKKTLYLFLMNIFQGRRLANQLYQSPSISKLDRLWAIRASKSKGNNSRYTKARLFQT